MLPHRLIKARIKAKRIQLDGVSRPRHFRALSDLHERPLRTLQETNNSLSTPRGEATARTGSQLGGSQAKT